MERIDTKTEQEISIWLKEQKIDLEIEPTQYWKLLAMLENYHQHKLKLLGIANVSKRFSSAEKMAEWLHNNYEEIALNNGWKTQEDCQVPFCDLPKENKQTMIEVCERFLNVC